MDEPIHVEVAAAWPQRQVVIEVELPQGSTVSDAIRASEMAARFPELEIQPDRIGIFGQLCRPERLLKAGDRVELYRPLKLDPKEVRRLRAESQKG